MAGNPNEATANMTPEMKKNRLIYESEIGRDFTLISRSGTEHPVHKVILNASSPVFARMFASKLEEYETGRCEIPDVSATALDALLRFMYYGCLDIPEDQAKDVLAAADKYELLDLKEHCERLLIQCLVAKDQLVHLLLFADKFSAPKLLAVALHYLVADPTKTLEMPNVDELLGSGNSNLVKTVFAEMLKKATNRASPSQGTRAILSRGGFRGRGGGVVHIGPARQSGPQPPGLGFNYPY